MANKDIKFDFGNNKKPVESNELKDIKPTETATDDVKLTDNTNEKTEDNKETDTETATEEPKKAGNVLVSYIGSGVWIDSKYKHWSKDEKANVDILASRTYSKEEYELRDDLKFMVGYGEMKAIEV